MLEQLDRLSAGPLRDAWIELVEPGLDALARESGPLGASLVAELEQSEVLP